MTSKFQML